MKSASIELAAMNLAPGLSGLVEGVATSMAFQGEEVDTDVLLGISSAAFCNYAFDPELNQHEETRREFSTYAGLFSNYGAWESLGYYTGWEVREVNGLPPVETLKVLVFEMEHGRPIVTLTPDLEPTMVTGYSISVEERVVRTQAGDFPIADDQALQLDDALFRNWLLLVRPGVQHEWAATPTRQKIDVLRWAIEHGQNPKEFFQETRENYAPGVLGIRRFQQMLVGLKDPAAASYAESYVRQLQRARSAAAACLADWAEPIATELGESAVEERLLEAAEAYAKVSHALSEGETFVEMFEVVEPLEVAALAAMVSAGRFFPSAFEA